MVVEEDILTLGMRADEARRQTAGARVWYQRVHVLGIGDVQPDLTIPEPASEVRLLGTPSSLDDAVALVRAVKEAAGPRPVSAFSLADLLERAQAGWGTAPEVMRTLAAAGLADVAEAPADLVPDLADPVRAARAAGLLVRRITVANPAGDLKPQLLERVRRLAREVGIDRFAPLPRNAPVEKPTTGYEDVRMVALARLALSEPAPGSATFIEVDWILYGPKLAQVALTFGADFLDAVPATSDESLGRRRGTVEDVERNIRAAGFEPQEYRNLARPTFKQHAD
jgi:aminodeoxyfutalosine synthase